MTSHAFKASYKYQLKKLKWAFAVILLIAVFNTAINLLMVRYFAMGYTAPILTLQGMDISCMGTALIFSGFMKDFLNVAAANGVSRKTAVISSAASFLTMNVAISAFTVILFELIHFIFGVPSYMDNLTVDYMYGLRYDRHIRYGSQAGAVFEDIIMLTAICMTLSMAGMVISCIEYRISRRKFTILFVSFITIFFIIPGIIYQKLLLDGFDVETPVREAENALALLFGVKYYNGSLKGDMLKGGFVMTAISAVSLLLSLLIAERSSVKPVPVRA